MTIDEAIRLLEITRADVETGERGQPYREALNMAINAMEILRDCKNWLEEMEEA